MGKLRKSNMRRRVRRSMLKSDGYTRQTEIKCNSKTGTYLACLLQTDWSKCWIERKKWIECVNTAYERWTARQATKNKANQPLAPLWNKKH